MSVWFHVPLPLEHEGHRCIMKVPLRAIGAIVNNVRVDDADDRIASFIVKITAAVIDAAPAVQNATAAHRTSEMAGMDVDVALSDTTGSIGFDLPYRFSDQATQLDPYAPIPFANSAGPLYWDWDETTVHDISGVTQATAGGQEALAITICEVSREISNKRRNMLFKIIPATKMGQLRQAYADETARPVDVIRMVVRGRQVEGHRDAQSYGVQEGDIFMVVLRLRGS